MAAEWVKVEKTTPSKIEVLHIASILNIHPDQAFGMCFRFWVWCDDNMTDCHAAGVTTARLNLALGVTGFAEAMIEAGWLETDGESISVPKFDRHLSQSSKRRALSSNRQKVCRAASVTKAQPKCDKSAPKALPEGEGELEGELNTNAPPNPQGGIVEVADSESEFVEDRKPKRRKLARSVGPADAAVAGIEIDGALVMYDDDPLRWEAAFIAWWNLLPGVAKTRMTTLNTATRRLLMDRLGEPDWHWKQTVPWFPLWVPSADWMPTLSWFVEPATVAKILEGRYEERKPVAKWPEQTIPDVFTFEEHELCEP